MFRETIINKDQLSKHELSCFEEAHKLWQTLQDASAEVDALYTESFYNEDGLERYFEITGEPGKLVINMLRGEDELSA